MTDVLEKLSVQAVHAFYGRLAAQIEKKARDDKLGVSIAALLLRRWLANKPKELFTFDPPAHLTGDATVHEVLLYHHDVYLTKQDAKIGKSTKRAGVVPRVEDGRWNGKSPLDLNYESLVEISLLKQISGTPGELDLLYGLHGFQLRTDVTVAAAIDQKKGDWTITFSKFTAKAVDRYDWDYDEHISVPNPDYGSKAQGAVAPGEKKVVVYHKNAKRLEDAHLAAPYNLESKPWKVAYPDVTRAGVVHPRK